MVTRSAIGVVAITILVMAAPMTTIAAADTSAPNGHARSTAAGAAGDQSIGSSGVGDATTQAFVDVAPSQLPGSGTAEDPYVITNASELQAISDDLDAAYRLGSDIDASGTANWHDGKGFEPIGRYDASTTPSEEFTGTLDGDNHTISNLYIDRPSVDGVGLFAVTNGSVVRELHLSGTNITGDNNVGAVSGNAFGGTVENVTVSGSVSGDRFVGGVVGQNQGTIRNVYSEADVSASDYAAGIAATNLWSSSLIDDVVAVGRVQSTGTAGGVIAFQNSGGTTGDAYWDVNATGRTTSAGDATGLTTAEMTGASATESMSGLNFESVWRTQQNDYPRLAFWANNSASDGGDGSMSARVDVDPEDLPGSGTIDDPYELSNASELQAMADAPDAAYELTADINASGTASWNDGKGFEPIGNSSAPFTGRLVGNGHTIYGLTINRSGTDQVGLFARTGKSLFRETVPATVTDLRLEDVSVTGGTDTGALAGVSVDTQIANVTVTGTVSGEFSTGGVVGTLSERSVLARSTAEGVVSGTYDVGGAVGSLRNSTVRTSSATVNVTGTQYIGGLVGNAGINSSIRRSYALGTATGDGNVGGLLGYIDDSNVSNSYAAVTVSGGYGVGGLVGGGFDGAVTDSYWDTEISGTSESRGGTGLTTAQMTGVAARSNMSGLAFGSAWTVRQGGYPALTGGSTDTPSQPQSTISQCGVIDQPGVYRLASNITTDFTDQCIQITADNVTLDGQGYTIDGVSADNTDKAVFVGSYSSEVSNVTVRNLSATNSDYGVRVVGASAVTLSGITVFGTNDNGFYIQGSSNVRVSDAVVTNTGSGVIVLGSDDVTVTETRTVGVSTGIAATGDTDDLSITETVIEGVETGISVSPYSYGNSPTGTTVANTTIRDAQVGISLDSRGETIPAYDTVVRSSRILDVDRWTVYTEDKGKLSLVRTQVTEGGGTATPGAAATRVLTGSARSVAFRAITASTVPEPSLFGPLTPVVNATNTTGTGTLNLTVAERPPDGSTVPDEALRLVALDAGSWEPYPGATSRIGRTLSATVTNDTTVTVVGEASSGGGGGGGGGGPSEAAIAPFAETTEVNRSVGLPAGVIRAEEPFAGNVSVELVRASATNYTLAITAPDAAENVTVYVQEQAVTAAANVTDLVMYLDGEQQPFVRNESAGPGDSPWIAFNVPHFSTRTVTFTGSESTADAIVVDDDGTANYTSIQNAIDNASAGATVEVRPGTYTEQIVVDKNITLVAPDGATLDGPESDTFGTAGIQIAPDSVAGPVSPVIRGFTIDGYDYGVFVGGSGDGSLVGDYGDVASGDWVLRNVTVRDSGAEGIEASEAVGDWRIADSAVYNTTDGGIYADGATGEWVIEDTVVVDAGDNGIRSINANSAWTIRNVTVRNAGGAGIDAGFTTSNWVVRDATLVNNSVGISAAATSGDWLITDSRIRNNAGDGISLSLGDQGVDPVSGNWTVTESVIANNGGAGLDARNVVSAGNATRNWWGAADGPGGNFTGSGDEIVGDLSTVTVRPYYVDSELTTLSSEPSTTVRVGSAGTAVNGTVTVPVVLSNAPAGVSGYNVTVTVANGSVATISNATVGTDFALNDSSVSADGTAVTLRGADLDGAVQPGATEITLATVTLTGVEPGTTSLSVTVNQIDDDDGTAVAAGGEHGDLTVRRLPTLAGGAPPTDLDGDGDFEDLNGNGRVDFDDLVILFRNFADPAVTDNVDAYDFNDNGVIDYDDLVTLFDEI